MAVKAKLVQGGAGTAIPAGMVGETIQSILAEASAVVLTSGVYTDVTSITLPAGKWSISCVSEISVQTSAPNNTLTLLGIATASGNTSVGILAGQNRTSIPIAPTGGSNVGLVIPDYVVTISASQTYYLKTLCVFSAGGNKACGTITGTRIA